MYLQIKIASISVWLIKAVCILPFVLGSNLCYNTESISHALNIYFMISACLNLH